MLFSKRIFTFDTLLSLNYVISNSRHPYPYRIWGSFVILGNPWINGQLSLSNLLKLWNRWPVVHDSDPQLKCSGRLSNTFTFELIKLISRDRKITWQISAAKYLLKWKRDILIWVGLNSLLQLSQKFSDTTTRFNPYRKLLL